MNDAKWRYAAIAGLFLDQVAAFIARTYFPGLLHVNPILSVHPALKAVLAFVIFLGIYQKTPRRMRRGIYLLLAGLASNVLSVVVYGGYSDYIPTGISYVNLADLLVTAGIAVLLYDLLFERLGE